MVRRPGAPPCGARRRSSGGKCSSCSSSANSGAGASHAVVVRRRRPGDDCLLASHSRRDSNAAGREDLRDGTVAIPGRDASTRPGVVSSTCLIYATSEAANSACLTPCGNSNTISWCDPSFSRRRVERGRPLCAELHRAGGGQSVVFRGCPKCPFSLPVFSTFQSRREARWRRTSPPDGVPSHGSPAGAHSTWAGDDRPAGDGDRRAHARRVRRPKNTGGGSRSRPADSAAGECRMLRVSGTLF